MIEECEFAQLMGTTVKLRLKSEDGVFRNHYHKYKSVEKAEAMYNIFSRAITQNGGTI